MFTNVDTGLMKEIAINISNLVFEYNKEITDFYSRLSRVPFETKEWVGDSSENYFKQVLLDKTDFLDFSNQIREFSTKIMKDAQDIEDTIKKNKDIEGMV